MFDRLAMEVVVASHEPAFSTLVPGVLTICTYVEFAPFSYEADGAIVGSDIALLRRFARHHGLSVSVHNKPFPDLWLTPGAGWCDVAAAGLGARADRDLGAHGVWSRSYMTVQRSLLIRRTDVGTLRSPGDFVGKSIVVTPASAAHVDAQERYVPHGAHLIPHVPSQDEVVKRLLRHDIDAFGEGDVSNAYLAGTYLDAQGLPLMTLTDIHSLEPPETLHFAVRAADPRLVQRLNACIECVT